LAPPVLIYSLVGGICRFFKRRACSRE
jgi:hypothetical protein